MILCYLKCTKARHMTTNMAVMGCVFLLLTLGSAVSLSSAYVPGRSSQTWPVPYKRVQSRPQTNPYCQAGVIPFCPTGRAPNTMPTVEPTDTLYVYAMKAPVWEFKFGDLLGKFHIMHDAIGFHHVQSGMNLTMEWYELFQLFNCTFPHELEDNTLLWCNQGAACIYDGIDAKHWSQNGSLIKVADISGDIFNQFAKWTEWDNNTGIYYETWTVRTKPDGPLWFDSWECATWVLRAFQELGQLGAKFNHSVHLKYTRMNIYSKEPTLLGNATTIFGKGGDKQLAADILQFYRLFQSHQSMPHMIVSLLEAFYETVIDGKFYLFYNEQYWLLHVVEPFFKITYDEVPLP
ncbi:bis(monoacylglycero)phosphate synthase CLN5-like [Babylonia areolata]|uniref:bis(monoacylglycero)phosphate synthase CLN5-like n=1 Tax=Babylonia areolata TaxID=304850 RepID=UPI003FD3CAB9